MTIRFWKWFGIGALVMIALLLYLVFKLPLSLVFGESFEKQGITDLNSSSLSRGEFWLNLDQLGLTRVDYRWCPLQGIGSWCVDLSAESAEMRGVVTPRKSNVKINDAVIDRLSSSLLSGIPIPIEGNIRGEVESLNLASYNCPLRNISDLSARLKLADMELFGAQFGVHELVASSAGAKIKMNLSGDAVSAVVEISDGAYQADGQLVARGQIGVLARNFMTSLGDDRYSWKLGGKIPC